ncbi:hypothetical protein I4U23_017925 [Adineta vaga]|nr:hypothetical protein I4U23_017925 [Adineta vaga]
MNETKTDSSDHQKSLVENFKELLPNPAEILIDQIIHLFIQCYNRRILILATFIMITIPIYMIIIGGIFFHSCLKSFFLPLYMIICGITSLIAAIMLISIFIIWKRAIKLTSKLTFHLSQRITIILAIFEVIFLLICLVGSISLTIILIKISSTIQLINQTSDYCHRVIYYSSYVLLFLFHIILSLIMIILFLIFHQYQKTQ